MSREAKSFLCLSMTTLRGGLPGIGLNGSMTCANVAVTVERAWTYLGVDVRDSLALLAVEAVVGGGVAEVLLAEDHLRRRVLRLVSLCGGHLRLLQDVTALEACARAGG